MKAEFQKVIKLFEELEEAGETAFLTLLTRSGKSTIKLQLESSPSSPSTMTSAQTLPPASGRRRRHRGARARARRNQRAAAHQTSQAEAATSASLDSQPSRPLRLLPSPPPESGRRRVMSCVGRLEVPTFTNLDGAPPSSPPCSPPPPPPGGWPPTKEEVVRYHRMMSKENQCCLCNFKISDPCPEEGQLCGLLSSMCDHIEERHPEEEDWFDETFASTFLDV